MNGIKKTMRSSVRKALGTSKNVTPNAKGSRAAPKLSARSKLGKATGKGRLALSRPLAKAGKRKQPTRVGAGAKRPKELGTAKGVKTGRGGRLQTKRPMAAARKSSPRKKGY